MVDAQPRSAECRVPIRLHNYSRFGRQRNGGLFGLGARLQVVDSWCRRLHRHDVGDCRTAGLPGLPLAGAETTLSKPNPGSLLLQGPVCNFFSMIDGAAPHWCRDPLWSFCATTS